jgi:hypothetical protein
MVARGGIEPPTRGFSVSLSSIYHITNQSLAALATPHSSHFRAHFGHSQSRLDADSESRISATIFRAAIIGHGMKCLYRRA